MSQPVSPASPLRRLPALPFALCALLACPAFASEPQPSGPDVAAANIGGTVYQRYCATCHGQSARGDGPLAGELRTRPPDLTSLASKNGGTFPYKEVVRAIDGRDTKRAHGTTDMPVWGDALQRSSGTDSPDVETAVSRLAHYLWSVQKK